MSRIFEALQRADQERQTAPEIELQPVAEPAVITGGEEPPPPFKADIPKFANIANVAEVAEFTHAADFTHHASPASVANATSAARLVDVPSIALEDVELRPWKPVMASFPTLADRGAGVEQFRSLRSRMYQHRYDGGLKTILVCSGMPAEGKSFITANLAMSLARDSDNKVLLIDGDLRRPSLHNLLGTSNEPGLSEYLAGTAELNAILQRDRNPVKADNSSERTISNLTFIPSGKCGDNASELAANHRIDDLIAAVSPHFDWILIDSPPVLAVTDAVDLAHAADAVLLIARGASTSYDVAQRTQAAFANSRILGFILNDVKDAPRRGSYYYYYGGAESSSNGKRPKDHGTQG